MNEDKMKSSGLTIHCHHDVLIERCDNFKERVDHIKSDKPKHEKVVRLKVFKILSDEAILALPETLVKADTDRNKAYADWNKADADWNNANADLNKAYADWDKANADWHKVYVYWDKSNVDRNKARADWNKSRADWNKVYADWEQKSRQAWHKKFCGCKEWNGKELVFPKDKP